MHVERSFTPRSSLASDECAHLRATTYDRDTNVYLLCFSLVNRSSFESIAEKWYAKWCMVFKFNVDDLNDFIKS